MKHNQNQLNMLTRRERDVLKLLCQGLNNREIADRLFISVNTVKYHIQNIYQKLKVNNRARAIIKIAKLKTKVL